MNTDESKRRIPWKNILLRVLWGLGMIAFCMSLDFALHTMGIVKKGYSHPHGFGTLRQLFGWLGGWSAGWLLMHLFVYFRVRIFGHKDFKHLERAAIWAGFALLVLLLLPTKH